jgi:hypothetical protein
MTAREIAAALGKRRLAGHWWRCVCPVHGTGTGRSLTLALRDHERGLVVRCRAGCSREAFLAELCRRGLYADDETVWVMAGGRSTVDPIDPNAGPRS